LRIRVAAFLPITQKPSEIRMGKGKGKVKGYISVVNAGHILFEIISLKKYDGHAKLALLRASVKLPMLTKIIKLKDR
jgi:large subunit ribosomal protein L16